MDNFKEALFAQYWGQEISYSHFYANGEAMKVGSECSIEFISYLVLKPLSAISDEDSKAIGLVKVGRETVDEEAFYEQQWSAEEIDYLRSKGYALPYRNVSVDEMVELGLIKLQAEGGEK